MTRNKLYIVILVASLTGYAWLGWNLYAEAVHHANDQHLTVCMFKSVTGVPCPSCGVTRSVLALLQGNIGEAFSINPLGVLMCCLLPVLPVWVMMDYMKRSDSFLNSYRRMEKILQRKIVAIPAIALLFANWLWSIHKHL